MDGCYVPNNPQYGLQLECQWPNSQPQQIHCNGNGNGDPLSLSLSPPAGCWGTPAPPPGDDMGSFSMPLDLDPLPTLFPFSPCTNNYKTESNCGPILHKTEIKPTHDMADVLLSLKHAVVHPGQGGNGPSSPGYVTGYGTQQPQLTYTVHPHQMLMSPTSGYASGFCDQLPGQTVSGSHQVPPGSTVTGTASMFPSMSVNVSMNMTYHHPAPTGYMDCQGMQWTTTPQTNSPGYIQNQNLLSPTYPGATYSFTADFRPPVQDMGPLLPPTGSSFKPVLSGKTQFSPVRSRRMVGVGYPGKLEEDEGRPNLCRICGKTYARPSTLKTHLRTHSGEKPYRCLDCNKSFSQAANLTAHVRTHSGEKPFRCPICDRRFSQSSSVTTHMRTHSGERPYRCRMCKKAFSDSSTLTKHLRIHSGEKPYQCKLCLLRFSQSGNLNRHMRVHGTGNTMLV